MMPMPPHTNGGGKWMRAGVDQSEVPAALPPWLEGSRAGRWSNHSRALARCQWRWSPSSSIPAPSSPQRRYRSPRLRCSSRSRRARTERRSFSACRPSMIRWPGRQRSLACASTCPESSSDRVQRG
ncbi:hypothetical protein G6F68_018629 [Rhizopus microsporus]|nr:hypothetical protein G6F68_018629 [Rhizopus microsporus]